MQVIGRRPIKNLDDNLYYIFEINKVSVYSLGLLGFPTYQECIDNYITYKLSAAIESAVKLKITTSENNLESTISDDKANFILDFHDEVPILVNNIDAIKFNDLLTWLKTNALHKIIF